jgi:hypothetical protein
VTEVTTAIALPISVNIFRIDLDQKKLRASRNLKICPISASFSTNEIIFLDSMSVLLTLF